MVTANYIKTIENMNKETQSINPKSYPTPEPYLRTSKPYIGKVKTCQASD